MEDKKLIRNAISLRNNCQKHIKNWCKKCIFTKGTHCGLTESRPDLWKLPEVE